MPSSRDPHPYEGTAALFGRVRKAVLAKNTGSFAVALDRRASRTRYSSTSAASRDIQIGIMKKPGFHKYLCHCAPLYGSSIQFLRRTPALVRWVTDWSRDINLVTLVKPPAVYRGIRV